MWNWYRWARRWENQSLSCPEYLSIYNAFPYMHTLYKKLLQGQVLCNDYTDWAREATSSKLLVKQVLHRNPIKEIRQELICHFPGPKQHYPLVITSQPCLQIQKIYIFCAIFYVMQSTALSKSGWFYQC